MGKYDPESALAVSEPEKAPKLKSISIRNFRSIGPEGVHIDIDDIIVLVGPNNSGKSSILRAYEIIMGGSAAKTPLELSDFHNEEAANVPEIIVETFINEANKPGEKWIINTDGEQFVRERWTWKEPGAKGERISWRADLEKWADSEKEKNAWGADNVAVAKRPSPCRIDAFANPQQHAEQIKKVLVTTLSARMKVTPSETNPDINAWDDLIQKVDEFRNTVLIMSGDEIKKVEQSLGEFLAGIFPSYIVQYSPPERGDLEKGLNLFSGGGQLKMGPKMGLLTAPERQGSGALRALLWAALKLDTEQKRKENSDRPCVLLIDEPELCLHPDTVREACRILYDLPENSHWQVIVTTHSPQFIDFSRDNTSIVRVERSESGAKGTTIFRPKTAKLGSDDKENLKLLNIADPHVAEFFFGNLNVIVEGDTEYTAFRYIMSQNPQKYKGAHVIRARGKSTIASVAKILNQFGAPYAILHDADTPTCMRAGKSITNPAWTANSAILAVVNSAPEHPRLVASLPNFEGAFLDGELVGSKPENALNRIKNSTTILGSVEKLLDALLDPNKELPANTTDWDDLATLGILIHPESSA